MPRRHITDIQICQAVKEYELTDRPRYFASTILVAKTGATEQVVLNALKRAKDNQLIEWGISIHGPWLTTKGKLLLKQYKEKSKYGNNLSKVFGKTR